jgi:hypothetical protein
MPPPPLLPRHPDHPRRPIDGSREMDDSQGPGHGRRSLTSLLSKFIHHRDTEDTETSKDEGGRMKDVSNRTFILHPSNFILVLCVSVVSGSERGRYFSAPLESDQVPVALFSLWQCVHSPWNCFTNSL